VVAELNASNVVNVSYVLGNGQLISQKRGSTVSYYLPDAQSSTRLLTSSAAAITDTYRYSAFGDIETQTGTTTNSYLFTGQQFDSSTGLYSLRARYYDAAVGRFLSRDTWAIDRQNPMELNRYVYAANNPIRYSDPSGYFAADYGFGASLQRANTQSFAGAVAGFSGSAVFSIAARIGACGTALQEWASDPLRVTTFIARNTLEGYWMGWRIGLLAEFLPEAVPVVMMFALSEAAGQIAGSGNLGLAICSTLAAIGASAGYNFAIRVGNVQINPYQRNPNNLELWAYDPRTGRITLIADYPPPGSPPPPQLPGGGGGAIIPSPRPLPPAIWQPPSALPPGVGGGGSITVGVCSFSADTSVATADGDIPIADIKVGDEVLAYNEATGENSSYEVTATHAHEDPITVNVTMGGELLETTPEHPFYTADNEWVAAGDLEVGDDLRRADGSYGEVQAIEFIHQPQVMYNLTVDEAHTFFVGDGQWLVHNTCTLYPYYPGGGHHIHAKRAFQDQNAVDIAPYNHRTALAIRYTDLGIYAGDNGVALHQFITTRQAELYRELGVRLNGSPSSLEDHSVVELNALVDSGIPINDAIQYVNESEQYLRNQGITQPNCIPWFNCS
jgi:RHS repeat-associated protein